MHIQIYYTNREDKYIKIYEGEYSYNEKLIEDVYDLLDGIFDTFNNDDLSPLSYNVSQENQQKVKDNKTHTSMSINDIIEINDRFYIVKENGFGSIPFFKNSFINIMNHFSVSDIVKSLQYAEQNSNF